MFQPLRNFTPPNLRRAADGHVTWAVDRRGIFLQAFGSETASQIIGQSVWTLHREHSNVLSMFRRLFEGVDGCELIKWTDGSLWLTEAKPTIGRRGRVIGAIGISWRLEPDPLDRPVERRRTWRINGLPYGCIGALQNGDEFIKIDGIAGVGVGRAYTDLEFFGPVMMALGKNLELVSDSCPPSQLTSPRRFLRVL